MAHLTKVRELLTTIREIAIYLTDEEISEMGVVLLKALERMESEVES